jgi:hypothetical protein
MIAASPTTINAMSPMLHASTLFSVPHANQMELCKRAASGGLQSAMREEL